MRYWVTAESEDLAPYREVLGKLNPQWIYRIRYHMFEPTKIHSVHTQCIVTIDTMAQLNQMIKELDKTNKGTWRFTEEGVTLTVGSYCLYDEEQDTEEWMNTLHIKDTFDR